jgi:hypothetical protein
MMFLGFVGVLVLVAWAIVWCIVWSGDACWQVGLVSGHSSLTLQVQECAIGLTVIQFFGAL